MKTVLVERYAALGGVCLNVGCIRPRRCCISPRSPKKRNGWWNTVNFGLPTFDLGKLRVWKSKVVGKLTGGLAGMAKVRKVEVVRGVGRFLDTHHVEVTLTSGDGQQTTGEKKWCTLPRRSSPLARKR